jgi:8-oxo-dGTP diphosphatase
MMVSIAGIATKGGELFIARRVPGGEMGGKWEFPGGKLEDGESCREAVVREFLEEFGVRVTCGEFIGESNFMHKGIERRLKAYHISFSDDNFTLTAHSEWRWADAVGIRALDFTPSDLALLPFIEAYLQKNGKT